MEFDMISYLAGVGSVVALISVYTGIVRVVEARDKEDRWEQD